MKLASSKFPTRRFSSYGFLRPRCWTPKTFHLLWIYLTSRSRRPELWPKVELRNLDRRALKNVGPSSSAPIGAELDLLSGASDNEDLTEVPTLSADGSSGAVPAVSSRKFNLVNWGPIRRWQLYREGAKDAAEIWGCHDLEENESSRLPPNETLSVPAVWVAELYTPSTVSGLLEGIRKLGWEHSRSGGDSLAKWMSDVREGRSAGWTSLGVVSPVSSRHFMTDRVAVLPTEVKAALPMLMSLTPSITALSICFILDDTSATA